MKQQQSLEQRIVVVRVLTRYAAEHTQEDWNRPVLSALEKWIEKGLKRIVS